MTLNQTTMLSQATAPGAALTEERGGRFGMRSRFWLLTAMPSWAMSMFVHLLVFLAMALVTLEPLARDIRAVLTVGRPLPEDLEEIEEFEEVLIEPLDVDIDVAELTAELQPESFPVSTELATDTVDVATLWEGVEASAIAIELSDFGEQTAPKNDLLTETGSLSGTGFDARSGAARATAVRQFGGNQASEAAVALALKWLAAHQLPDGGWNFDHRIGPGERRSGNPGSLTEARRGATSMALLPFLGAGQTHKEGPYRQAVAGGLQFLLGHMKPDGSLHESGGNMYSHGLATIALCEAYGMTHDRALMRPAQAALNFIVYAQDPIGGGWRYQPRQPGDTSVVGWQVMALKSGHLAYLSVPAYTVHGAIKFLDGVDAESGAFYGYTTPGRGATTTAVGLLLRMYLGWKRDHGAIQRGVEFLAEQGPSETNMYYNYYATQVIRHYGGQPWEQWNAALRDFLVQSQTRQGPATGSWHFAGPYAERGGRLYNTSLAAMILEVYYRHMPLYRQQASQDDFAL